MSFVFSEFLNSDTLLHAIPPVPSHLSPSSSILGQSFALEQILGEVASHTMNTELSEKPLVLLFSGPPGHGKTEMAKQLADLLSCPFHKVDCRNHANPWEMFGSGRYILHITVWYLISHEKLSDTVLDC